MPSESGIQELTRDKCLELFEIQQDMSLEVMQSMMKLQAPAPTVTK